MYKSTNLSFHKAFSISTYGKSEIRSYLLWNTLILPSVVAEISNDRRTSSFSTGKIFNAKELFIIVPTIPDEALKATASRLLPVLMLLIYNGEDR